VERLGDVAVRLRRPDERTVVCVQSQLCYA
jgi:hypothetical protein